MGIITDSRNAQAVCAALNRIAGQARGVGRMVEEGRYCIEVLHQLRAVKAALARVETQVLKAHAACCVEHAIASGDAEQQRRKFNELVEIFAKART